MAGEHGDEVGDVVGATPAAGHEVVDLEAVADPAGEAAPALAVAQQHRPGHLRLRGREPPPERDRDAVVVDEDRFDRGVGPELLDSRVGQRDAADGGGPVEGHRDLHERPRGSGRHGLIRAVRR